MEKPRRIEDSTIKVKALSISQNGTSLKFGPRRLKRIEWGMGLALESQKNE